MDGDSDGVVEDRDPDGVEGMDRFSDVVEMAGQEYLVLDGLHVGLRGEENHTVLRGWLLGSYSYCLHSDHL